MKYQISKKISILGNEFYELRYKIPNTRIEEFTTAKTIEEVLNKYWCEIRPELKRLEKLK